MLIKIVVVVLVTLIGTSNASVAVFAMAAVRTAVSVINDVTTLATGMDGLINLIKNDKSNELFQEKVTKKLNDIHKVCTGIDDVKGKIENLSTIMEENTDKLAASIEFINAKRIVGDFKKNVDYVNKIYFDRFSSVWNNIEHYARGPVDSHIQGIVSDSTFDRALSEMLSDITSSPNSQSSIFSAMSQYYDTRNGYQFLCKSMSPLDDLHIFYSNVLTTFARGYAVLLMSYQYLKLNSNDYEFYQDRQNTAFQNFQDAIKAITQHAKIDFDLIADTDYRASYACDPREWKEGENFIRVKNYISVQFPKFDWSKNTDTDNKAITNPKEYDCEDGIVNYEPAPGAPDDTRTFLCTKPFSPNLTNPYSVEYEEIQHFCNRRWETRRCLLGTTNYDSYICELDHNSDPYLSIRKLSLKLQECNTSKNEVVTDARFHEQNNKIHIKLQCGVLKNGKIDVNTLRWTEDTERFSESDPRAYAVLSSKLKSYNLDNIVVPHGHLVTGAGFRVADHHFISLVVKANKVNNYYHGNAFGEDHIYSVWNTTKSRKNIDISDLERPLRKMAQTHVMSKAGKNYINLTLSSWSSEYHNDAIVPYFDMTPYDKLYYRTDETPPTVAPLGGLGLFYKSLPNYTGFLAFKHLSPTYIQFVDIAETTQSYLRDAQRPFRHYRTRLTRRTQ